MLIGSANIIALLLFLIAAGLTGLMALLMPNSPWPIAVGVAGLLISASPRIVYEWERSILLRLGKYKKVITPGITWIIPGIDALTGKIDMRVRSTAFSAEKTLTKDTVPVNVDAVLFWLVSDAGKAILEVEDFIGTISWAAQTTLRDVIGKTELAHMISEREILDRELQSTIDAKTSEWGIKVKSVEIRDIKIPAGLEDAMSRKAQADREKDARIILATSELKVAEQIEKAAEVYQQNEKAMQLRAMNMTYEAVKEKGALMVIPSGMADAMNFGTLGVAAAAFRHAPTPENRKDDDDGDRVAPA